jgi:hypothetical protein
MYFRERGGGVQLVRTTYEKDKKRPKQEVIGRMLRRRLTVPDEVAALLTNEEKDELASYVERTRSLDLMRRKVEAHSLLRNVTEAIAYAREVEDPAERDLLRQEFAEAIIALRRASTLASKASGSEARPADDEAEEADERD